jgi:putative regulator of septum formation
MNTVLVRIGIVAAIAIGGFVLRDRISGNVTDLHVGDCFDVPSAASTVKNVQHHPCTEPHLYEAFAELKYPGAESTAYPGQSAMGRWAESQCVAAFSGYVGIAYSNSALAVSYFTPTSDGWGSGDHTVNCIIGTDPPATLTASLKGSNR